VAGLVDFEAPLADLDAAFQRAMEPTVVKGMVTVGE
jgi:L-iditol 2-dehydrogenase